ILMNCVLALLDYPGATLLGINRLLVDKEYRARVIAKIRDPIVKTFWVAEFTSWSEKYATEAIAPVQNKVGQFLSSSVIRNIVAQVKTTLNLRRIMDDGKILIANLSKGRIGEDNMRLLGGMLITKLQMAAQERQNILEEDRRDFYLYVDEFQNFANESFAHILSEARKYRLNLVVTHQYIEQLDEKVAPAIFGNVGTLIVMRVGAKDAEFMETEFAPTFTPEDLVNLAKTQIYLKLMVDGVSTQPFSANTLPPIGERTGNAQKVIAVSRERYAQARAIIETKVLQWSGLETVPNAPLKSESEELPAMDYPEIKTEEEREAEGRDQSAESVEQESSEETLRPAVVNPNQGLTTSIEEDTTEYLKFSPERLASIEASKPQPKKNKPQYPHTCTRCGKVWNLAIQLDPTRPMYCPECRPIVMEEREKRGTQLKKIMRTPPPLEDQKELPADVSEASFAFKNQQSSSRPPRNRPRIVQNSPRDRFSQENKKPNLPPAKIKIVRDAKPENDESLLDELSRKKGGPVQISKEEQERRAGAPPSSPTPHGHNSNEPRGEREREAEPSGDSKPDESPKNNQTKPPSNQQNSSKPLSPGSRIRFD
ncbi:MAG TPA: TraM recognition domain-containing protein, partial [Patescibacteria group bacterium]|nr:TraM recognition domain-containing protein [Patescibacteria group bacterium]